MTMSKCFFEDYDWGSCFWLGQYDSRRRVCKYSLSYFEYVGNKKGEETYVRTDDYITEKIWSLKTLRKALAEAGFSYVETYDNTECDPVNNESRRIYFAAFKA